MSGGPWRSGGNRAPQLSPGRPPLCGGSDGEAWPMTESARIETGNVIARSDPRWSDLRTIVEEHSLLRGDFTLTSGRKSSYLFQLRQTTMLPEGQFLIGTIIAE